MVIIHTSKTEQPGGWFSIQIVTLSELSVCPPILTNGNAYKVEITAASEVMDVLPVGETIRIDEPPRPTKSGMLYNIKADFELAKQSSDLDDFLNKHHLKKVVVIATKHDGQKKMYGSKISPLTLFYEHINGKKLEDGSKISVSVEGKTTQKPVFMNA